MARNRLIFDNMDFHISHIDASIMRWIDERHLHFFGIVDGSHRIRPHEISIPSVFFDGACKDGIMGCGAWVKISGSERIHLHWNGGLGTNNKAEFMSIWGALVMVIKLRLTKPSFYGDSRLVVECIQGNSFRHIPRLQGWLLRIKRLCTTPDRPTISHIFRENNRRADDLSKRGINDNFGSMYVLHYRDGTLFWENTIPIP